MALWDLAGKLLGQPVHKLLGGKFRDELELYSHCPQGDFTDEGAWPDRAAELKADPHGFHAFKVDIHSALGLNMQEYVPSLSPGDIRKVRRSYELRAKHLGDDIDIIVHCHCELDTPSAIAVAEAVEDIRPLYYEDPMQPGFSENWLALRRTTRIPIMTGENLELPEDALPFLQSQAVDCLQPDIVKSGGITGTKRDRRSRRALPHADHAAQCQRAAAQRGEPAARRQRSSTARASSAPAAPRASSGRRPIRSRSGTAG